MLKSLALLVAASLSVAAADHHVWHTGRVLDSHSSKSSIADGATTNTNGTVSATAFGDSAIASGQSTSSTTLTFANIRDNQLVIVGSEFAYVVEDTRVSGGQHALVHAIANRHHGCRFIVGDDVRYWQDKSMLHVLDVDGKECKVDVLRQERVQPK